MLDITHLKVHLEGATPFVTPYFHPDFILGNSTIMPGELIVAVNIKFLDTVS